MLVEDYVMDSLPKILHGLREFNVTLRWLLLHRQMATNLGKEKQKEAIKWRDQIWAIFPSDRLLLFLLKVAQFEFKLKSILQELMKQKQERWTDYQKESQQRMTELSEYFSGDKPLTRIKGNQGLQDWFAKLASQIEKLSVTGNAAVQV